MQLFGEAAQRFLELLSQDLGHHVGRCLHCDREADTYSGRKRLCPPRTGDSMSPTPQACKQPSETAAQSCP